jgi:hypothetical protein
MVSRNFVYPGSWVYVWSRQGGLDPNQWYLAQTETSAPFPLPPLSLGLRSLEPWDEHFHHALRIPDDVPPGKYQLYQGGVTTGVDMTVDNAPDMSTGTVIDPSVSDPTAAIEAALQTGNVWLNAGAYVLSRRIRIPAGRTVRGDGAFLVQTWDFSQWVSPFFQFTGDGRILFEGLTFVADRRPAGTRDDVGVMALADRVNPGPPNETPAQNNVTLRRCVFRNVYLGEWPKPGFLAEDCRWEEGGGCDGVTGAALFLRCTFRGLADPSFAHAWSTTVGSGMALLDCDFLNTDRCIVLRPDYGPIEGNLFSGLMCDGLAHVFNGCEGIALEGRQDRLYWVRDNLFFHYRYRGEGPGLIFFFVTAENNLLKDFVIDGGGGIFLSTDSASPQRFNVFEDGEVRGGRCVFDPAATENTVRNVAFVGPRPTRSNQFNQVAGTLPLAVVTNFANNLVDFQEPDAGSVKFSRLLDEWKETDAP